MNIETPGETLPSKRFVLSLPPLSDPEFARVREYLADTVTRTAIRLRAQCAIANNVSFFDTVAEIVPDPDRPNFITVTARSVVIPKP